MKMISEFFTENEELISQIVSDIQGMTVYMNLGIGIALCYGVIFVLYVLVCKFLKKERKLSTGHAISVFALLIYVSAILFIVFMSREPGQYNGVNLHLLSSWGITTTRKALFIENIIMFIPMGMLLPAAFKIFRNPLICIVSCVIMSSLIEHTQFLFKLGFAEIDDVVTNTLGGAIGWIIWGFLYAFVLFFHKSWLHVIAAVKDK
ncbi:VanZ family protein [Butyrivibrio sp. JL13D10]|uniref:VanZ family protein n=1 Tax=Butyrivibrio sp. JL13D10 TaxID=3236815 RepID=UPI0038B44EEF